MEEIKCNGERCQNCKYCRKNSIRLLKDDITAQRWRYGLMVGVIALGVLSFAIDLFILLRVV